MIGCININVISFAKLEAGSDWSVMNHCHSGFDFHIIPIGRGHINIQDTDLTVNKGEFYITGPYVMHSQVSDSEMPMEESTFILNYSKSLLTVFGKANPHVLSIRFKLHFLIWWKYQ
ncbi:AraC family ligand binding domain-containing protein [Clostridium estertheticum]|uniref:AraC family ligand binding domain-containing protein n=1 Tax=Clostridium estertheticum TaxID=238834 RepID=UPI0013E97660|nr:AraC family ligand binding domain-containing protein [Clostridium estertheticum]